MNLLDPHALDDSLAALSAIKSKRTMVEVTLRVPVDDLDLSNCKIELAHDVIEWWGSRRVIRSFDFEPEGVTFAGFPVEISDHDLDTVFHYIKEARGL